MSQRADIDQDFQNAINSGVGSEEDLLKLKLDVYESLEWDSAAEETAKTLKAKGYSYPGYYYLP